MSFPQTRRFPRNRDRLSQVHAFPSTPISVRIFISGPLARRAAPRQQVIEQFFFCSRQVLTMRAEVGPAQGDMY